MYLSYTFPLLSASSCEIICKVSENEVGQRSRSRSRHGTIGKVLSQRTHMPSIKALPVIVQKLMSFCDRGTDRRTDRGQTDEWDLMSPCLREMGGKLSMNVWQCNNKDKNTLIGMFGWLLLFYIIFSDISVIQCYKVVQTPNFDLLPGTNSIGN